MARCTVVQLKDRQKPKNTLHFKNNKEKIAYVTQRIEKMHEEFCGAIDDVYGWRKGQGITEKQTEDALRSVLIVYAGAMALLPKELSAETGLPYDMTLQIVSAHLKRSQ